MGLGLHELARGQHARTRNLGSNLIDCFCMMFSISSLLTAPCITAAVSSTEVHLEVRPARGPSPARRRGEERRRVGVLLYGLEEVGQVRRVLDLRQELVQLRMLVWLGEKKQSLINQFGAVLTEKVHKSIIDN